MPRRLPPTWWADARFWVLLFVIGFWPAVLIGEIVGLVVLLVIVGGGAFATQRMARSRAGDAA